MPNQKECNHNWLYHTINGVSDKNMCDRCGLVEYIDNISTSDSNWENPTDQKILEEFNEKFPPAEGYEVNYDREAIKSFLLQALKTVRKEERERLLKELNHEQEKLLDGFSHPKDCKECLPLKEEPK